MQMRGTLAVAFVVAVMALLPSAASAWAPADQATIHPGVQTVHRGRAVHRQLHLHRGGNTYIGQAAHCAGTGAATDTNGCDAGSLPLGTPVEIDGRQPAGHARLQLVARPCSSTARPTPTPATYNDFALVKIDPADVDKVNPSVPGFGGPTGVGGPSANRRRRVLLRQLLAARRASPSSAPSRARSCHRGHGWSRTVYTVTPGIPGDSGSGS